jgi:hypothetical protein
MAKGISINFLADVKDFLRGTKNVEDELDDVADSLDDVAKDGDKATEKLEKSFKDLAKAAKASGDDIEKGIGQGTRRGTQEAEKATDVYKKEAIANVSEVTSSFTGSWESAADAVQGTLGGVVADLGPAGMAIGAAGALGIGLLTQAIIQSEEEAEEAKTRIAELGQAMIDAGASGEVPLEMLIENLKEIVSNSDEARKKFQDIEAASRKAGTSAEQMAIAYAGNNEAIEAQIGLVDELIDAHEKEIDAQETGGRRAVGVQDNKTKALEEQRNELIKIQEETAKAAEIEQAWLASGGAEYLAKQEAISNIDQAYDDAVFSVDNFVNQETGLLDVTAYIASMEAREKALNEYQTALANSDLTTEQKAALNEMGVESAAAWMAGYNSATPEQKATMKRFLTEAAKESSGQAVQEIEKAFKDPIEAKVEAIADTVAAEKALENVIRNRSTNITVRFKDPFGRDIY